MLACAEAASLDQRSTWIIWNLLQRSAYLTVNDIGAKGILGGVVVMLPAQPDHQQGLLLMKF
jgi:hypothetical protein